MLMTEAERLLTTREVAELLAVHPNTVKRIGDRGDLPFVRVVSRGDRRYRRQDVARYLARTSHEPEP